MKFRSLLNKTEGDGKYIFAQPTMIFRNKALVNQGLRKHIVREDEVTRPDLIALEYYGDQTKTDLILKWNGISDPFSLQPGDELIIPPSGVAYNKLERPTVEEDNNIKNQFLQSKRFTKKDQRRLDALKKKYNKDVLLPPNVIPLGQKNYKFDKNGNIIFGAQAQNGAVNARTGGNGSGGSGSGNGNGSGGDDAVVDAIFEDLGQGLRDEILAAQGTGSSGAGAGGSGSGLGKGLTETQLNNLLDNKAGKGTAGKGLGSGSGVGSGSGSGGGTATQTGNNSNSGTSPSGSNNASGVSNDGAPCN